MSETRSHLYNQQEVNAIVAEKLEPLFGFRGVGWRVVLGIAKPHKSTVEFDNYPAPGAVLPLDA